MAPARRSRKEPDRLIHPWDAALDPAQAPVALPLHFTGAGDELLIHLARPNPVWPHLEAAAEVRLAMFGDYAYIPTYWRAKAGGPEQEGVPTSYYTAVQFLCLPRWSTTPTARRRSSPPSIRGVRLEVLRVDAKLKYDDHKPVEHRERVVDRVEQRDHGFDAGAATQQRRRLAAIGDWQTTSDGA